jgi:hypothetical protein
LKTSYHALAGAYRSALYAASPVLLARMRYLSAWHRLPNLDKPQFFDEKLLWLMLYWHHPLKTQCADKYLMRAYAEEHGFEHALPRLFGVYQNSNEIELAALPDRFVLKCTHGCKCNIFCTNKKHLDMAGARRTLDSWMKVDFSKLLGEVHYAGMKPRIICEEFLEDGSGELPSDYKVYSFQGKAHCTMVCSQRSMNGTANYDFYDRAWQHKLPYSRSSLSAGRKLAKPAAYEDIIATAERLSKPFPFVRMDFYSIKGWAVLGEMTFTPSACLDTDYTDLAEKHMGELIQLPEKLVA